VNRKSQTSKSHKCEWLARAVASEKQCEALTRQVAEQAKRIAALERCFARKSEKGKKLPSIKKPLRTKAAIQTKRDECAAERAEAMETVVEFAAIAESDKQCAHCNDRTFSNVGAGKVSEQIHYVRGHFRKVLHQRETCKCRCGKTIITAPPPARWSPKTKYAASVTTHLIVQKIVYSTPLYRLESAFAQQGHAMPRSTMTDLLSRAATTLSPLYDVLCTAIRQEPVVHIDETSFKMTAKKGKKSVMWTFVGAKHTLYDFSLTRSGSTPVKILGCSKGFFVTDDYSGYNQLARLGGRTRCGCMAHARRGFSEAGAVPEAELALALIQEIYAVEHEAERLNIRGTKAHLVLRTQRSKSVFMALIQVCRRARKAHAPKTTLAEAARYVTSNVKHLKRFLYDPNIPPDNNVAENVLRIIALGRKNYLFAHSEKAAQGLALLYSLSASCKQNKINPFDYFEDVLDRILDEKVASLRELLPDRWKPKKTN
jgi:transposase